MSEEAKPCGASEWMPIFYPPQHGQEVNIRTIYEELRGYYYMGKYYAEKDGISFVVEGVVEWQEVK